MNYIIRIIQTLDKIHINSRTFLTQNISFGIQWIVWLEHKMYVHVTEGQHDTDLNI